MSVYKRTVRGRPTRNYYYDFVDEEGRKRTLSSGTSDKRLAERIKRQRIDRVRAIRAGLLDPSHERYREEAEKPLRQHVDDYLAACRARGDAERWVDEKERQLEWLLEAVHGRALSGIRADEVDARLAAVSDGGRSARTVNLRLECANAFLNWCVRNGRLRSNPLRVIQRRNQVVDRRRCRRVLKEEETRRLIAVARMRARTIPGAETRPLWYMFPLLAGLRRGDMERMIWKDVDLMGTPPTLTIRGGKARKRVDVLPLHSELAQELRMIRPSDVLPSARVFSTAVTHATRRKDFQRAGIVLETEDGHADLHALRHTYGTRLAQSGVAPATLQKLMRHATVQMTMAFYVHLDVAALGEGLSVLPGTWSQEPASEATAS